MTIIEKERHAMLSSAGLELDPAAFSPAQRTAELARIPARIMHLRAEVQEWSIDFGNATSGAEPSGWHGSVLHMSSAILERHRL